jgi:23S rRNA (adenine2503-C2)-methyltransferase
MLFTALYSLILLLMLSSARRRVVAFTTRTSSLGVRRYSVHDRLFATQASRTSDETSATTTAPASTTSKSAKLLNLSSVTQQDLQTVIVDGWGYPKFRAAQVWNWIREQGVTDVQKMTNVPAALRQQLEQFSKPSALELALEETSKDGTIKRAYRCADGQVIESVLMPYSDGRYTACISSQAGCAQGCVFCATGQMGFSRQLTADEIFEQVARFAAELKQIDKQQAANDQKTHGRAKRLSNVVFMGM